MLNEIWTRDWYESPIPDNAYVPRVDMPQIEERDYPSLFAFLAGHGCKVERVKVDPRHLRFHQSVADFDPSRLSSMPMVKPILIARDRFILDGNHRAKGALYLQRPIIDAFRMNRDFEPAIALLFAFPNVRTTARD